MDIKKGTKLVHTNKDGAKIFAVFDSLVWIDVDGPETGPEVIYDYKVRVKMENALVIVPLISIEPLLG